MLEIGKKVVIKFRGSQELVGVISEFNDKIVSVKLENGLEMVLERSDVQLAPFKKTRKKKTEDAV